MSHLSLYRRFRPQRFDEVVGQDNTIATLTNQIELGHLAHAYLFTGSRGTGKTSTAKILARAVNCQQRDGVNPCNSCATCQSILNDANIDVIEMDAASNNGVDDIRELREIVKFAPSSCRYKVVIIDEVHMLSKGAFNALLKTLEEPPQYIIFILATTEPHKVPATISSRCQHFAFRRIDDDIMLDKLRADCQALAITAEQPALELIVKLADGALRDAQSLLEQSSAYGGTTLTYQLVSAALGRTADQTLQQLASCIIARDQLAIIDILAAHYGAGKDSAVLIDDLIALFRSGLVASIGGDGATATALASQQKWLAEVGAAVSTRRWQAMLNHLLALGQSIKYQTHAQLALELGLLELTTLAATADGSALAERVAQLEQLVGELMQGAEPTDSTKPPMQPAESAKVQSAGVDIVADMTAQLHLASDAIAVAEPLENDAATGQPADNLEQFPTADQSAADGAAAKPLDLTAIKAQWAPFMAEIKNILPTTFALMKKVEPIDYADDKLTLKMDDAVKVLRQTIMQDNHVANIKRAFNKIFNSDVVISVVDEDATNRENAIRTYFKGITDSNNIIIE